LQRPHIRAASEVLIATILATALVLPALDSILSLDPAPAPREKRALAALPRVPKSGAALLELPQLVDSYVADHFGFRSALIRLHTYASVFVLGVSPSPSVAVMIGRDGWFYYTGDDALAYIEGRNLLSDTEVAAWRSALRQRSQWLARQGIPYLVVFAPDKPTIYPEFLPRWVRPSSKGNRLDQILAAMKGYPEVDVLDLRPTLLDAKRHARVYLVTDTHWNSVGAYAAYHAIMSRVAERIPRSAPIPFSEFNLVWGKLPGGDLADMLDLQGLVSEAIPWTVPKRTSAVRTLAVGEYAPPGRWPKGREPIVTECPQADVPRVVVLRDSFATALVPYLSEHFGRAVYLWTPTIDPAVIEAEHPNLVIQEYAERLLSVVGPENPPEIAAERLLVPPK
jgi:alginate O-acetyltransferase complex protein AlgJ